MTPRSDLFQLIHSLTPSEKRYFKIFSSDRNKSQKKIYHVLFDAIDRMNEYDEVVLKKELKGYGFVKHLSVTKKQLTEHILRSLWAFNAETNLVSIFRARTEYIRILYLKGLHRAAIDLLTKAYEEAKLYEQFTVQLELLTLKEGMFEDGLISLEEGAEIYHEQATVLKKLENYYSCIQLTKSGYVLMHTIGYARSEEDRIKYEAVLNDPRMDESYPLSHVARRNIYNTKIICCPMIGDTMTAFLAGKKLYEIDAENEWLQKLKPGVRIHGILNYVNAALLAKQNESFQEALQTAKRLLAEYNRKISKEKVRMIEARISSLELGYMNSHPSAVLTPERIAQIEEWVRSLGKRSAKIEVLMLELQLGYNYLVVGEFERALKWLSAILQKKPVEKGQLPYLWARILNLIIHFELKNFDYLDHEIRSTERYIEKLDGSFQFEITLLKYFRKFLRAANENQIKGQFTKALAELSQIEADPNEKAAITYINVPAWLKSKITGSTYAETLAEGEKIKWD